MYDCTDCTFTLQHHDTKPRVACVTERYLTLTQHHTTSNTGSATCGLTLQYSTIFNTVSHEGPSIWHSCSLTPTTQTPQRGGGRTESSFKLKNRTHPVGNGHCRKQLTCSDDNGQRWSGWRSIWRREWELFVDTDTTITAMATALALWQLVTWRPRYRSPD